MEFFKVTEEIAEQIEKISNAVEVLHKSRLKSSAVVTLLQHETKLPRKTIEQVLVGVQSLRRTVLKP